MTFPPPLSGHKPVRGHSFRAERTTTLANRGRGGPLRMDGSLAPVIRGTTIVLHTLEIPMTEKLGQTKRVAEFITPLGKDELGLVRFEGTEGLGELFDYHVDALSKKE